MIAIAQILVIGAAIVSGFLVMRALTSGEKTTEQLEQENSGNTGALALLIVICFIGVVLVACDSSHTSTYDHRTPNINQWQSVIDQGVAQ